MDILFECDTCAVSFSVLRTDGDLPLLGVNMACPKCEGHLDVVGKTKRPPIGITGQLLWQACQGRGLPEERDCSPEALKKLMVGARISDVELKESRADENRSIIIGMDLAKPDSECTVCFGMSTQGATIYKVIRPGEGDV